MMEIIQQTVVLLEQLGLTGYIRAAVFVAITALGVGLFIRTLRS